MSTIPIEEKLALFQGMLACAGGPRLSCYDGRFHRIQGEGEALKTGDDLFALCRRGQKLDKILLDGPEPMLFTGRIGLLWLLCPVTEAEELVRIYALGPFLQEACSAFELDTALANAGASLPLRGDASVLLRSLPVVSLIRVQEYAAMLYYLVAEERMAPQELRLVTGGSLPTYVRRTVPLDDRRAYEKELETLRRVQEGDVTLGAETDRVALGDAVLRTGPLGNQLRQMKGDVLGRLALLSRAAMAGGLSPETGYALWEKYSQAVEAAQYSGELISLLMVMQEDFSARVHAVKTHRMSRDIEAVCGFIERHLTEPLRIQELAARTGYAEYYFSRKFKRETGLTPAEHIRKKRLEKAAALLLTTGQDIKQIGADLQFCSQSYFADSFRRQYGVSPSQYRRAAMP